MIGLANANRKSKPQGIAGRDFVSWSQLSTFRQCPLRYRFRYLDKIEPEFVASSLLIGSAIHSAIELVNRQQLEGNQCPDIEELLAEFWAEWKSRTEEANEVRFGKTEDIDKVHQLAVRMLTAFLASGFVNVPGVVIGIEESLRATIIPGRPEFLGIVDLAFEANDVLVIRDYKTSRSKWNQGNAESSGDQLRLYGELAKSLLPDHDIRYEFVVLTKTKSPTVELFHVQPDTKRAERTKLIADRTLDAIESGVFYPSPSPMNCSTCPYRSACSTWRG